MPLMFVLIPYFTERQEAMRVPVVTFATMGLCLLTLVIGRGAVERRGMAFVEAVEAAADYARLHPGLDDGELRRLTERFPEQLDAAGGEEDLAGDQAALDALVEEAWTAWRRQPWVRIGLVRGDFRFLALFTHPFLHMGWIHLLGNLLFMWLAMSSLENVWSRGWLVGFYLACGAVGGAVQMLFMGGQTMVPLIGASGAVAGLMGAYLVCFARSRIRIWYFLWVLVFARTGKFHLPAWAALPLWFGFQLLSWLGLGTEDVGYAAHVGGFVFGAAGALAFTRSPLHARFSSIPEADLPEVAKDVRDVRAVRIAPQRTSTTPAPDPAAAPWDDTDDLVAPPPAETSDELVANIHDWMASSDAGKEAAPEVPWTDDAAPVIAPVPWTDDSMAQVATARPGAGPVLVREPPPAHADRFTTDESLMVSAPWGRVADPAEEAPITARLRPRTSRLTAIETQRLTLETAEGAPFKVPFEQVIGVFPAHIGGDEPFDVCDLVQGIHRTGGGVLVETVRLPGPLQRFDEPFVARVIQLMTELAFVRTWPDARVGEEAGFPIFDRLDEYERALLRCIAEEG